MWPWPSLRYRRLQHLQPLLVFILWIACTHGEQCADWCNAWTLNDLRCHGCKGMAVPTVKRPDDRTASSYASVVEGEAVGPLNDGAVAGHAFAGWVGDNNMGKYEVIDGALKIQGNARAYLIQDHHKGRWADHKYVRIDLQDWPLRYTVDLSHVQCRCLACVYM